MGRNDSGTFVCNNCGEEVSLRAKACPHCGADDETGWKDHAHSVQHQGDDFDYDEFVRNELPGQSVRPRGVKWWVWLLAVLLLGLIAFRMLV
jgi:hypothetical protein